VFNESVFASYANLQNFLNGSEAVQQVIDQKNRTTTPIYTPFRAKLDCKWEVCQVATAPFRWILAFVLDIISKAFASKELKNISKRLEIGFDVFSEDTTPMLIIKETKNRPNTQGEIVNNHSSIPLNRIPETRVREKTLHLNESLEFNHREGICRGIADWFLYLYLKTRNQFNDPRAHMRALGKQFSKGGGMEATLLQSLFINKGKLLGLNIGFQSIHSRQPISAVARVNWQSESKENGIKFLQDLPVGAYAIRFSHHQMAFVKCNNNLAYYFDPSIGIIEIQGPEMINRLHTLTTGLLNINMKHSSSAVGDRSRDAVDFVPYTLR
jgi:hypothetical protein